VLDLRLVEEIAAALGTEPGLVEKEWHVVRAIGVIAALHHGDAQPVFSGGTSLSVGWGLIKRFSEDIDFKVGMPDADSAAQARTRRRGAGREAPQAPEDRIVRMFELLTGDALWAKEYEQFVHDESFARADEVIPFAAALAATRRLADRTG